MAMQDCGALVPLEGGGEEEWEETMRRGVAEYAGMDGGEERARRVGKEREEADLKAVRQFVRWFDGKEWAEIRRVAGMVADSATTAPAGNVAVGVGGGVIREEDFLEKLKKRYHRAGGGEDARLAGTVLGKRDAEGRGIVIEGGPVQHLKEWRPRHTKDNEAMVERDDDSMTTEETMEGS